MPVQSRGKNQTVQIHTSSVLEKISDEWLEEISDEEKAVIESGLKQLDNGEGIPHKKAIKRLKWYPK